MNLCHLIKISPDFIYVIETNYCNTQLIYFMTYPRVVVVPISITKMLIQDQDCS